MQLVVEDSAPAAQRVRLAERSRWITPTGRTAAVAFPVIDHPTWGLCTAATVRATINGHTGQRMKHAGDVVLFGGAIEPAESADRAALRELFEESNTLDHTDDLPRDVREHLGTWVTESGVRVEGFLVDLPWSFVDLARPDPREVAAIGFLGLDRLFEREPDLGYHHVDARDTQGGSGRTATLFESPTISLPETVTGDEWTLWGAAGYMAARAREALLAAA